MSLRNIIAGWFREAPAPAEPGRASGRSQFRRWTAEGAIPPARCRRPLARVPPAAAHMPVEPWNGSSLRPRRRRAKARCCLEPSQADAKPTVPMQSAGNLLNLSRHMKAANMEARDEVVRVQPGFIKYVPPPAISDLYVNTGIGFWKASYPCHYQRSTWKRNLWGTLKCLQVIPGRWKGEHFPLQDKLVCPSHLSSIFIFNSACIRLHLNSWHWD